MPHFCVLRLFVDALGTSITATNKLSLNALVCHKRYNTFNKIHNSQIWRIPKVQHVRYFCSLTLSHMPGVFHLSGIFENT